MVGVNWSLFVYEKESVINGEFKLGQSVEFFSYLYYSINESFQNKYGFWCVSKEINYSY